MHVNNILTKVAVLPDLFDAATCARAIALAQRFPATEGRVGANDVRQSTIRRSQIWYFDPSGETEFIFAPLSKAVQQINEGYRLDLSGFGTGCQIARYSADDQGHYDWHIDLGTDRFSRRKLSMTVQLSPGDAYDGGDLDLHIKGLDHRAMRRQGTLIRSKPAWI